MVHLAKIMKVWSIMYAIRELNLEDHSLLSGLVCMARKTLKAASGVAPLYSNGEADSPALNAQWIKSNKFKVLVMVNIERCRLCQSLVRSARFSTLAKGSQMAPWWPCMA